MQKIISVLLFYQINLCIEHNMKFCTIFPFMVVASWVDFIAYLLVARFVKTVTLLSFVDNQVKDQMSGLSVYHCHDQEHPR